MRALHNSTRTQQTHREHRTVAGRIRRYIEQMIAALAGGVGAARFLRGLADVVSPSEITAVVNTGDDFEIHGLHVSPDLDTVIYTLAGVVSEETGWGLAGETWRVMSALERLGGDAWFRLGDADLATHLYRTQRLRQGAALSEVCSELASNWGLDERILPATDQPVRTLITLASGKEIGFQDYFVRLHHDVRVREVRFAGGEEARPGPGVLEALRAADTVVVCPSNPIVSIGPVLAVPGIERAVSERRDRAVAISPIVAGSALKGPADRLLRELGHESSVVGVARLYAPLVSALVIDEADEQLAQAVEDEGVRAVVTRTVMATPGAASDLARAALAASGAGG